MKFLLEIETNNAAFDTFGEDDKFQGADGQEVADILFELSRRLRDTRLQRGAGGPDYAPLRDSNGNRVGYWKTTKR